jgi:hypothetical protein
LGAFLAAAVFPLGPGFPFGCGFSLDAAGFEGSGGTAGFFLGILVGNLFEDKDDKDDEGTAAILARLADPLAPIDVAGRFFGNGG